MLGALTCALVRMFGGKHDYKRTTRLRDNRAIVSDVIVVRECRRCGYVPPKRVYKRKEAKQ